MSKKIKGYLTIVFVIAIVGFIFNIVPSKAEGETNANIAIKVDKTIQMGKAYNYSVGVNNITGADIVGVGGKIYSSDPSCIKVTEIIGVDDDHTLTNSSVGKFAYLKSNGLDDELTIVNAKIEAVNYNCTARIILEKPTLSFTDGTNIYAPEQTVDITTKGDDANLAGLKIDGDMFKISPVFNSEETNYEVTLPSNYLTANFVATPSSTSSTVTGEICDISENEVTDCVINVVSADGTNKEYNIKVTKKDFPIESISLNKGNFSLELAKTYQLNLSFNPTYTTDSKVVTWKSSNTKYVTVSSTGKVTAKKIGSAYITAYASNGMKVTIKVTVTKVKATSVSVGSVSNKTYTGGYIRPSVTAKYNGKTLKKGTDYTLSYGSNRATGKASIKITYKGNYTGTKTIYFYIVPKKVTIKTPTSPSKKVIQVNYYKTTGASGYLIAYRLKGTSTWSYTPSTGASKKITSVSGKTYEVRVRAYKTVSSVKYYGSWSSLKTIKSK